MVPQTEGLAPLCTPDPSFPAPDGSSASITAHARRAEATAARLRKATPNLGLTAPGQRAPGLTALSSNPSVPSGSSRPDMQSLNAFKHGHDQPGETQVTVIMSVCPF